MWRIFGRDASTTTTVACGTEEEQETRSHFRPMCSRLVIDVRMITESRCDQSPRPHVLLLPRPGPLFSPPKTSPQPRPQDREIIHGEVKADLPGNSTFGSNRFAPVVSSK